MPTEATAAIEMPIPHPQHKENGIGTLFALSLGLHLLVLVLFYWYKPEIPIGNGELVIDVGAQLPALSGPAPAEMVKAQLPPQPIVNPSPEGMQAARPVPRHLESSSYSAGAASSSGAYGIAVTPATPLPFPVQQRRVDVNGASYGSYSSAR